MRDKGEAERLLRRRNMKTTLHAHEYYCNSETFSIKKIVQKIFGVKKFLVLKNFSRMRVAHKTLLSSDFFHMCVAACMMEELSRLSCVWG